MGTNRCPNCRKIVSSARGVTDYEHNCTEFPEVTINSQEDIVNTTTTSTEFGATVVTAFKFKGSYATGSI